MGLFDLFRRSSASEKPDQAPEHDRDQHTDRGVGAEPEDLREVTVADSLSAPEPGPELDQPGQEHPPAQQTGDPIWTRAVELHGEFNRAMTLENTPAAFVSDEYDYDDDVYCDALYATPGSVKIERELEELVRAHPTVFTGTDFEVFAGPEDEHGEDQDRPPERDRELADEEIEDDAPF